MKIPVQTSGFSKGQRVRVDSSTGTTDWLVEFRLHHWVKNTLLFLPLALTPQLLSVQSVVHCLLGFIVLSITCSGTYLINDVFDRDADHQHWSKHKRPVASGRISIFSASLAGMGLCFAGLLAAVAINGGFAILLASYVLLSLAYSYYLKTLALMDIVILSSLFSLRVMMGVILIKSTWSPWLPLFVFLFFGGLSTAKRTAELVAREQRFDQSANRRGYQYEDLPLLIALGISFSIGSLMVLSVYLSMVAVPEAIYRSPGLLWVAVPLLLLWVLRIWIFAVRGTLPDDPVLFSLRDRFSLSVGVVLSLAIVGAHLP